MKKTAFIIAAALLMSFSACSSGTETASSAEEKEVSADSAASAQPNNITEIKTSVSSADMPLDPEQWGQCAKYSVSEQKYASVPVRLTAVERGSTAKMRAEDFLKAHAEYSGINRPSDDQEWAAVDYELVLDGFPLDKGGTDAIITGFVQAEDGGDIKDGDSVFFPVTVNISEDKIYYEGTVKGSFVFVLPKSCKTFLMVFGEYDEEQAFVKCGQP